MPTVQITNNSDFAVKVMLNNQEIAAIRGNREIIHRFNHGDAIAIVPRNKNFKIPTNLYGQFEITPLDTPLHIRKVACDLYGKITASDITEATYCLTLLSCQTHGIDMESGFAIYIREAAHQELSDDPE